MKSAKKTEKRAADATEAKQLPLLGNSDDTGLITDRYDIVVFVEGKMTNPNGDPDNVNAPRQDPETGTGIMTTMAVKRKFRDYLQAAAGVALYHGNGAVLRDKRAQALEAGGVQPSKEGDETASSSAKKGREAVTGETLAHNRLLICKAYYDARAFGAVMDLGAARAGNARGPVTVSDACSVDPVRIITHSITRQSVEAINTQRIDKDREMGSRSVVVYGLYRFEVTVNPYWAKFTGFTHDDLLLLRDAIVNSFEFDQSASRQLTLRGAYAFRHESPDGRPCLGRAPRASLLERVTAIKTPGVSQPNAFADYEVAVDLSELPAGITFERWA